MDSVDVIWMAVIVAGALYLLYRSVWKKKGHCQGCDSGTCDKAGKRAKER
ncbi:MAG: FeoB-associated Cys-rich membrane protein [Thermodesulfovibrionales bacterium]